MTVKHHGSHFITIIISLQSCMAEMPVDRSSCVDELYWSLDRRLFGILR